MKMNCKSHPKRMPKWTPNLQKVWQKWHSKPAVRNHPKKYAFWMPWTPENSAPAAAGVKFSLSQGTPKICQKSFQNGSKIVTIWIQNCLKRDLQKRVENSAPKWKKIWSPRDPKRDPKSLKMDLGRCKWSSRVSPWTPKGSRGDPRGVPGTILNRFWLISGSFFAHFLNMFNVVKRVIWNAVAAAGIKFSFAIDEQWSAVAAAGVKCSLAIDEQIRHLNIGFTKITIRNTAQICIVNCVDMRRDCPDKCYKLV